MRIQPKYLLLFSDAFIPILGFFVWNWSLYFIVLFYFLDLLAREAITHLKTKKIYEEQGLSNKSKWIRSGVISALLLLLVFAAAHLGVYAAFPKIDFLHEIQLFWEYEELGIQQGYLLIPLVGYGAYAQYKMQFLTPNKARTVLVDSLWRQHHLALILIIVGSLLSLLLSLIVPLPEVVYLLAIVASAAAFTLLLDKN